MMMDEHNDASSLVKINSDSNGRMEITSQYRGLFQLIFINSQLGVLCSQPFYIHAVVELPCREYLLGVNHVPVLRWSENLNDPFYFHPDSN